jgi:hypothetical protein
MRAGPPPPTVGGTRARPALRCLLLTNPLEVETRVSVTGAMAQTAGRPDVDRRLRAGALAFVLAALLTLPVLFVVHPPTDPAHNREFALSANTFSYRLGWSLQIYALTPMVLGMFAIYGALAGTRARRWALAGLVVTVGGACLLLPGTGFAAFVMPAAGVLISQGHEQDVLRLLDQVFQEPGWIAVFLGGIVHNLGLVVMGVAVWRSNALPRWAGVLLAAAGVVGLPAFLDITLAQEIGSAVSVAAFLALAAGLWQRAAAPVIEGSKA